MTTLHEYFEREADEYLRQLTELLRREESGPTVEAVHRAARGLRGTAQLARADRVYRVALGIEQATRADAAGRDWRGALHGRLESSVEDLRSLLAGGESDEQADARADAAVARWGGTPEHGAMLHGAGDAEGSGARNAADDAAAHEFIIYAAGEVAAIAQELERGVDALVNEPNNHEPVRAILRRQRALLGAARLDDIPLVAETLRAVEDLSRIIARLGVGVKREWLDVFRSARDVLRVAAPALAAGEQPAQTNASSRLRTLREELTDRYAARENGPSAEDAAEAALAAAAEAMAAPPPPPVAAAPAAPPLTHAAPAAATMPVPSAAPAAPASTPMTPTATPAGTAAASNGDVIAVQSLCYSGEAALRRALELRADLERAVEADPDAREVVDEVFDLLRLALD